MGPEPRTPAATPHTVRQQLARILVDPLFRQSQRLSVLLRFLVEATLAGRESELKEFVIGAEAFQRGPDFDPQIDNIVRVTASRLRSRLAEYYLGSGSGDPVVIALARGGYVPTFSAAGSRPKMPSADRASRSLTGTAVGRGPELSLMLDSFAAASNGSNQIIAITGEAGIGKTTLTDKFLSELERGGISPWVLRGRCSERLSETEPFLPVVECLEDVMQGSSGTEARRLMEVAAPSWLSRLEPRGVSSGREHLPEHFRREFVRFLRALSETRPVVLFWDDLHWVDASTVDLLGYVSSHLRNLRILLLTAYRPSAVLSAHSFISLKLSLERRGECREISLGSLLATEVEAYVHHLFPENRFPSEFASVVYERTEGHPLFMCDMLRFLLDREIITKRGESWEVKCESSRIRSLIPSGTQNMIRLEMNQLNETDRRILECAAVQGVTFNSAVVSKVLAIDVVDTEERLGRLALTHRFVQSSSESDIPGRPLLVRFRFMHVLYQNTLYAEIAPSRRVALSLAIAAALIDSGGGAASGAAAELAMG